MLEFTTINSQTVHVNPVTERALCWLHDKFLGLPWRDGKLVIEMRQAQPLIFLAHAAGLQTTNAN
jgi:hypothetical protein